MKKIWIIFKKHITYCTLKNLRKFQKYYYNIVWENLKHFYKKSGNLSDFYCKNKTVRINRKWFWVNEKFQENFENLNKSFLKLFNKI